MTKRALSVLLLGLGLAIGQPAGAVSGSSIVLGSGDDSSMARITLLWNWSIGQGWNATGFWKGEDANAGNLSDIGLTPVFRLSPNDSNFHQFRLGFNY